MTVEFVASVSSCLIFFRLIDDIECFLVCLQQQGPLAFRNLNEETTLPNLNDFQFLDNVNVSKQTFNERCSVHAKIFLVFT